MDPESELSERERRQDSDPIEWGTDVPFRGESMPDPVLNVLPDEAVDTLNAAASDAEHMTYTEWREHWQCAENGDLVLA